METYQYTGLGGVPCLEYVKTYIGYSAITHKDYAGASWSQDEGILSVLWETALDASDKAILDGIVSASINKKRVEKARIEIMSDIFWSCADQEQLGRLLNAVDIVPSFVVALDNGNYPLARSRVALVYSQEHITEADYNLVMSIVPEEEFEAI